MPGKHVFSTLNPWKFMILLSAAAIPIYLLIVKVAHSPRGRLNIMQMISMLFFLAVIVRQRRTEISKPSVLDGSYKTYQGMLLALVIGGGIWSLMVPFYFISDDFVHLYAARAPMLNDLWGLLTRGQSGAFMRPLAFASIFLDYHFWHYWAPGYHITNLLIHLTGVAGVYFLCKGLNLKVGIATTASLVYATLPVNAEAIAWTGARFDLLSSCLTIWATVFYLRFRETDRRWFYFIALVFFVLASFSKENAFALPLLLLSAEYLIMPNRRFKPIFGFISVAAILFTYRWIALGGIGGYINPAGQPATYDIGIKTLEGLLIRIPAQMLFGFNWYQLSLISILVSLTASILLIVALIARSGSVGWKRTLFCLSWIVLTVLPAHPLLFINANLTNSRILYLGSVGTAILIAQLLSGIELSRLRLMATGLLVCLLCIGVTNNLSAWRWTSKLSQRFLLEIKQLESSPSPNTVFVFHNMPRTIRGVFFLHAGLAEAIKITYNRDDLNAWREEDLSSGIHPELLNSPVVHVEWGEVAGVLHTQ